MEKDITRVITNFRNASASIFEMMFTDFQNGTKNLDRQKDDNVFQRLQARYISQLEKQLLGEADNAMKGHYQNRELKILQHELATRVSYLLSEFSVKARSM